VTHRNDYRDSRILIVDDQISNVRLLERLLDARGYPNHVGVTDSSIVLDLYRSYQPDLLLLDLRMPEPDGFQIMDLLQNETGDDYLPILVLTADLAQTTKIRALKAGAKDFLTKPFDQVEVITRISNMLEVRKLYRELRNQNTILERRVRERTEDLRKTQVEVIHRLSRAAEIYDQGTGAHIMRISKYTGLVASSLGLSSESIELIESASPMHDIGKIGIPDRILLKAGKLNEDEWRIMQTHTTIGADILSDQHTPLMKTASCIALTHHEKWDGSGYPHGLCRDEIPMEGRIVALCDVFDALVSKRPYKKPWSISRSVEEIEKLRGTAFDPNIVDAFHRVFPDVKTILVNESLLE